MKILLTAFDPFGGDEKNSSLLVLEAFDEKVGDIEIEKMMVPTVYKECATLAWERAEEVGADAILSLGQAGGRGCITIEVIGINYACSKMKDNNATVYDGVLLDEKGENAMFSTMPVKAMAEAVRMSGFNAELSVSAGGFVCNSMLYSLLLKAKDEGKNIPIGFVHLPYENSQGKEAFSMSVDDMVLCIQEMIKVI